LLQGKRVITHESWEQQLGKAEETLLGSCGIGQVSERSRPCRQRKCG